MSYFDKNIKLFSVVVFVMTIVNCHQTASSSSTGRPYEVLFSWKFFDFNFPTLAIRARMLKTGEYVPGNITVTGIKIHHSRMFLALPRARFGVPSTLNYLYLNDKLFPGNQAAPPLSPYPSWSMQQIGNCEAIQFAQSMEIDEYGRMWVFDTGRINILEEDTSLHGNYCPAKLIIFNLDNDRIVAQHIFPSSVVSPTTNFLNDIVVGCEGSPYKCWAYFTEMNDLKLVVFSLEKNKSWFVQNNQTMTAETAAANFQILGKNYNFTLNIDGIALSPKDSSHDRVYYSPTASFSLYSVPTFVLKSAKNGYILKKSEITVHTTQRASQSDGIMMDSEGHLFYGVLQNNSVAYVDTYNPLGFKKEIKFIGSDVELQWPDAFAFDNQGYIYLISIRLHRYLSNTMNLSEVNYRVVRVYTGSKSYVYPSESIKKIKKQTKPLITLPQKFSTAIKKLKGKFQTLKALGNRGNWFGRLPTKYSFGVNQYSYVSY